MIPPVHFCCPAADIWPGLRELPRGERFSDEEMARNTARKSNWVNRTYYELRDHLETVTIGPGLRSEAINVTHAAVVGLRDRGLSAFLVVIRADWHESGFANFVVEQNDLASERATSGNVGYWSMPGIRKRDRARGRLVETLAFKGAPQHLAPTFRSEAFREALGALDVGLRYDGVVRERDGPAGGLVWADYHDVDAVLAVRAMASDRLRRKPANKLTNAWAAETPALLGPEPAYRALRRGPLDYLEVDTPDAVIAAVRRLKEEPGLHAAMVENGQARLPEVSDAAITRKWLEMLSGPIFEAWRTWRTQPAWRRAAWIAPGLLRERRNRHRRWSDAEP